MTVDIQTAEQDINRWLDFRSVKEAKREGRYKSFIQVLVDAVCDGALIVDEQCNLIQKLSQPFKGEIEVRELKYKPRVRIDEIKLKVDQDDAYGMVIPYIAALTGQPGALVRKMDTEDWTVAQVIANFFM
jgi:hypothetical protein